MVTVKEIIVRDLLLSSKFGDNLKVGKHVIMFEVGFRQEKILVVLRGLFKLFSKIWKIEARNIHFQRFAMIGQ